MEKGDPSVHHLFRHKTGQSKRNDEDRPDRKRPVDSESRRLPVHVAPIGMATGRPPGPASEWPWRLIPPTASAPADRSPEDDSAGAVPAEDDESQEPTLLPAA
jgi:hypothetical protein